MKKLKVQSICIFALTLFLSACGSSGSSSSASTSSALSPSLQQQLMESKQYYASSSHDYKVDGVFYPSQTFVDLSTYPVNRISTAQLELNGQTGHIKIYNQPYSIVFATDIGGFYEVQNPRGLDTPISALPTGTVKYRGAAFDRYNTGTLEYTINFGAKRGSGKITGFSDHGVITLDNGTLNRTEITGSARSNQGSGNYSIGIYGPKGEEIAGAVIINNDLSKEIGFGGRR